ncbi:MAG: aminotransferase class V-fold PLP-dependent enzyme, partial [Rubripirellula sp.]
QALSAIPFCAGDLILTTRNDYASNQIQFLALEKRLGIRVSHAPECASGGVDVCAMQDLILREQPRLVAVTHVPTNSGLVQDVAAIGRVCRETESLYLVDACQSVGQMPLNVEEIGCDFLTASSRKFLRGPRGSGFLYVADRVLEQGLEPLFIDMRGADWVDSQTYQAMGDAKRFENWEFAWALVLGTGAAAEYALEIGLEKIQARVWALASQLREGMRAIPRVRVLDRGETLCGIVSLVADGISPPELVAALAAQRITASAQIRKYAVLDYDSKGVSESLRMAPHYITTEEEVDRAVEAVRKIVA